MRRRTSSTLLRPISLFGILAVTTMMLSLVVATFGEPAIAYKVVLAGAMPLDAWMAFLLCRMWGIIG